MSAPEKMFQKAISALNQKNFAQAERLFKNVLRNEPNNVAALNLLTVVLMSAGRFAEAEPVIAKAISLGPGSDAAHYNFGLILKHLNKPREALQQFSRALNLNPVVAETWNNRGTVLNQLKQYSEAIADFDRAISLQPNYAEAYVNRGKALAGLKHRDDAFAAYDKALKLKSNFAEAWLGYGTLLTELKRSDEAFAAYDKTLALKPDLAEAWLGRGTLLAELKRDEEAFSAYDKALALKPDLADAWLGRGALLADLKRYDEAFAAYDKALTVKPDLPDAWLGYGSIFVSSRRFDEALAAYQKALALNPNLAESWVALGNVFGELRRFDEAIAAYDKALSLKPRLAEAWLGRGAAMDELKRFDEAFAAYEQALKLEPDIKYAQGNRLYIKMRLCDWAQIESDTLQFLSAFKDQQLKNGPFTLLSMPTSPADQLLAAQSFVGHRVSFPALWQGKAYSHERIRIGYFSADFRRHPVAQLAVGLLESHDKSRFEISAISYGPDDGSELRERAKAAVESFIDVRTMNDEQTAQSIHSREIDVLIDLTGLCQYSRFAVLSRRVAPVQVNFLGYPGTMAANWMDYIIADRTIIPEDHFPFYAEKVVWLPDTYQPNDNKRVIAERPPTRAECNLPETGFVFCCFNNTHKITPQMFAVWMKLLAAIEDSVLWLLATNPTARENLRSEAKARGISPERVIFAPALPLPDHLARHRHADLFLDTLPYNAHTTASDALWAGLPVLTCLGETFAGRVAASLLKAAGLPELITTSLEDYEALALKLAREPLYLAAIKAKLARNRDTCALFDTIRFTRHIETAYVQMWDRYQRGAEPQAFAVDSVDHL